MQSELVWALGSICALHRLPFAGELVERDFSPPSGHATLIAAGRALALRIKQIAFKPARIERMGFPLLVGSRGGDASLGIVTAAADDKVVLFRAGSSTAHTLNGAEFRATCTGEAWPAAPAPEALLDPDTAAAGPATTSLRFGFAWFRKVSRTSASSSPARRSRCCSTCRFSWSASA